MRGFVNISDKLTIFIATGGGVGYIPVAPGTFGSLYGVLLAFFLSKLSLMAAILFLIGFTIFSIFIAERAEKKIGTKDPSIVVIDEIAGMAVAMFAIDFNMFTAIAGFLLFRIFDITKPFPISFLEKNFSGGYGIVADDIAAGVIANLVIRLPWQLIP